MKKSEWGPVVWTTLHVFSVHVRDMYFQEAKKELIETIINIMANLPCPNCSSHALGMVKQNKIYGIQTTDQKIACRSLMHNDLNNRVKKPQFKFEELWTKYSGLEFKQVMTDFYNVCQQMSYGEKMMMYNFHRRQFLFTFRKYININVKYFCD